MPLQRAVNLWDVDGIYSILIDAHRELSEADSAALNARLVLLLVNHIGDEAVIGEALTIAKRAQPDRPPE